MARKPARVRGVFERKAGSGVWGVQYIHDGKRVRKTVGTRQQAIDYMDKVNLIRSTGAGVVPVSAKHPAKTFDEVEKQGGIVTVGQLCDEWLAYIQARPTQYKDQKNPPYRIKLIKEQFGNRPAGSLRPSEIRKWLDSFTDYAPGTKNKLKANLSSVYRHGKENDHIDVNPARDVKREKEDNGVVRYLKPEEEESIRTILQNDVDAANDRPQYQKHMIHRIHELTVSLGTGLRKGEQYGLLWSDVDFERRSITARDTKNGETRSVPMIDDVREALLAIKSLGLGRKDRSLDKPNSASKDSVFAIGDNKKWWASTLKRAKVKNYRWHDNRHTFCSRLAQNGASLKVIQEAAGHKTIQMSSRYAHLHQTHLAEAMAVLNRVK